MVAVVDTFQSHPPRCRISRDWTPLISQEWDHPISWEWTHPISSEWDHRPELLFGPVGVRFCALSRLQERNGDVNRGSFFGVSPQFSRCPIVASASSRHG